MNTLTFQVTNAPHTIDPAPGPGPVHVLPDREWGLSARQVISIVIAIIGVCELLGLFL